MAKSYVNTAAANDTTALLLKKMDQLIAAYAALLAKLDADTGVIDTNYVATVATAAPVSAASELL